MTYIFDASAVLRYLDGEAGTERVEQVLNGAAVHLYQLRGLQLTIISVTADRAERCARLKAEYAIPYVDSLAVELAIDTLNSILITADFDMKPAERLIAIEFLPTK